MKYKACATKGCGKLIPSGVKYCGRHKPMKRRTLLQLAAEWIVREKRLAELAKERSGIEVDLTRLRCQVAAFIDTSKDNVYVVPVSEGYVIITCEDGDFVDIRFATKGIPVHAVKGAPAHAKKKK